MTLFALAIRVPLLFRPMRTDEAATFLYYASRPLTIGLSVYGSPNNHVLHTLLVHATYRLFGPAEWALRLPALLAGVALVPLAFLAARTLGAGRGLLAAALVATWPLLVDYSTDARGYTLVCAFTLVTLLAATRLRQRGETTSVLLFAIAGALGLWTVPVMLYPFAMLTVWALASPHWRRALVAAGLGVALAAIVYSPVLAVSGIEAMTNNPWVRPLPWSVFFAALPHAAAEVWRSWTTSVPLLVSLPLAILFVIGAIRGRMTFWLGIVAVMAILVAQHTIPFPRTWLPLVVLTFVTMNAGLKPPLHPTVEPVASTILTIALAICSLTSPRRPETGELPHVRDVAQFLAANAAPSDAIAALTPSDVPLAFYLDARPLRPNLGATCVWVITNDTYGQSLPKTLFELKLDPRRFAITKGLDYGDVAIYRFDRK
jgi:4-amino-4-deoxy-L-arabinose transferase-like glycosyltransferase